MIRFILKNYFPHIVREIYNEGFRDGVEKNSYELIENSKDLDPRTYHRYIRFLYQYQIEVVYHKYHGLKLRKKK